MVAVPFLQAEHKWNTELHSCGTECTNWARIAAGGSLLAGGLLLLTGRHRAGLFVAVSGTTMALLDQQEAVRAWWNALPGYIEGVQNLLDQVQSTVEEVSAQSLKLHQILSRPAAPSSGA